MIFRRFSFGGDTFTFDTVKYNAIPAIDEKIQKFNVTLEEFNAHYTKSPPQPRDKEKNHDVIDFYNVFVNDYPNILQNNLQNVLNAIPLFCSLISSFKKIEDLTRLIDIIFEEIETNGKFKENSMNALKSLFKIPSFCQWFILDNRLTSLFINFTKQKLSAELCEILQIL